MKREKITLEAGLYALAFLVGLLFRFYRLGSLPLGDREASLALQALYLAQGELPILQSVISYLAGTKLLFGLFEPTPFLARLLPALVGSFLIGLPFLFRRMLGKGPALILAFGLALDGALVAASRQVNGEILALTFLLAALGLIYNRAYGWAGISAALALMSGPGFLEGLSILLIVYGSTRLIQSHSSGFERQEFNGEYSGFSYLKPFVYWLVGTFLVVGSLFITTPQALGSSFQSVLEFLKGWSVPSGATANLVFIALLTYALLPLFFGVSESLVHFKAADRVQRILNLWVVVAFVLWMVYPGRQFLGLVWLVVPLWIMASRRIFTIFETLRSENPLVPAALAIFIVVLLVFASLNLSALSRIESDPIRLASVASSLVAIALLVILVAWGGSVRAGLQGLSLAVVAFLFVFQFSSSWNAAGLGKHPEAELFQQDGKILEADLLLKTIADQVEWNENSETELEVVVAGISSPSLEWALRSFPRVRQTTYLPGNSEPGIIVTPDQESLILISSYSGQNFVWGQKTNWSLILPREWLSWLFFREAPQESEVFVVWVRSDLFPGAGKPE